MRRCEGGFTVAEQLISAGLCALVMWVVGELTVASFRVHTRSTDRATVFRMATTAADRMGRELRLCEQLYAPARPAWGQRLEAGPGQGLVLVFRRACPARGADLAVGFRFDGARREVARVLYRPDFDPGRADTQVPLEDRRLAEGVDGLAFWAVDPATRHGAAFVALELSLLAEPAGTGPSRSPLPGSPLRVEVRARGL